MLNTEPMPQNNSYLPSEEVQSLCVQKKLCFSMKEFRPPTRYVGVFGVLAQLNKLHFLLLHVVSEMDKVEIGWHDNARLPHELSREIRQNLYNSE
jgi:hypothetical protein